MSLKESRGESLEEIIKRKTGEIKEILSQNSQELTALGFDWELFSGEKGLSLGLIDEGVLLMLFPNGTIHKTEKKTHRDLREIEDEGYLEYFSLAQDTINDVKEILSER